MPLVDRLETTMNHDLLNDEELSIVGGGDPGRHNNGGPGGGGKGTDGLGWFRSLIHHIFGF